MFVGLLCSSLSWCTQVSFDTFDDVWYVTHVYGWKGLFCIPLLACVQVSFVKYTCLFWHIHRCLKCHAGLLLIRSLLFFSFVIYTGFFYAAYRSLLTHSPTSETTCMPSSQYFSFTFHLLGYIKASLNTFKCVKRGLYISQKICNLTVRRSSVRRPLSVVCLKSQSCV